MAEIENNNGKSVLDNEFNVVEFIFLCLSRWYYFLISIVVCVAVGFFLYQRTVPVYTRTATILVKNDKRNSGSNFENQIVNLGAYQSSNVQDAIFSLQSPAVSSEVVKRLNLQVNYSSDGLFHSHVLYGDALPVSIKFLSLTDNDNASFTIRQAEEGHFILSDFKGTRVAEGSADKSIKGKYHTIIRTPVGNVLVDRTSHFYNFDKPIYVTRSSLQAAVNRYNQVNVAMKDKNSNMVNLTFQDVSPQRAQDVINKVIEIYNEFWVEDNNRMAISTSIFINERLEILENELGSVDRSISSFKSANMIDDAQGATSNYISGYEAMGNRINELNNEIYMAKYIREMVVNEEKKYELLPINSGINASQVESLIAEYNNNILQRNRIVSHSSLQTPFLRDLEATLDGQRSMIVDGIDNVLMTLNTQYKMLKNQENTLQSKIVRTPGQANYLVSIGREQKVKESLYIFLLQKREENELSKAFTAYNTRVITPPSGSNEPTYPIQRNFLLIALAIGFAIPALLLYLGEVLDTTVRGRKDLEGLTIPYIGEIPQNTKRTPLWKRMLTKKKKEKKKREIVVKAQNTNLINEAFRVVRSKFEMIARRHGQGVVTMFTSANVSSGKTFIGSNLAVSIGIKKKKVCIVDLDLRKATMSAFVANPKVGVVNYILGEATLDEVKYELPQCPDVTIIPVGIKPPNPTELLYEDALGTLIAELKKEFDYVFLDCPPVEIVADASIIRQYVDMTCFIVRAHLLDRALLADVEKFYTEQSYPHMCLVLNGTEDTSSRYGYHRYGYRYGYSNRYGYSYGYGTSRGYGNTSED